MNGSIKRSPDRSHRVCVETDFVASPRRGMPCETNFQRDAAIVRAACLCDLRTLFTDRSPTLVTRSDYCDMTGLVVMVVFIHGGATLRYIRQDHLSSVSGLNWVRGRGLDRGIRHG